MRRLTPLLWLYAAVASGYAIIPRDGPQLSPEAKKALEDAKVDLNAVHKKPKQKVESILAIGDSYTAGIGSNGKLNQIGNTDCSRYNQAWPVLLKDKNDWDDMNDGQKPDLTFGACSGNVMVDVREQQLKQGDPVDVAMNKYTPIGKPQIAVMTISGNDAKFSNIINDCIFRLWVGEAMLSCNDRLDQVEKLVAGSDFKKQLLDTYTTVVAAGRQAKGADPPENFQLYVGGYVGLFNHDYEPCDGIFWNIVRWGITEEQYLTRALRRRFNDLVDTLNKVIKGVANELEPYGVFYVEGYNDGFTKRRFCEKYGDDNDCIHKHTYQDKNRETAFWSYQGTDSYDSSDEGLPVGDICKGGVGSGSVDEAANEQTQLIKDIEELLVPNEDDRKKLSRDLGPWNVTAGDWGKYNDIYEALADRGQHDPVRAKATGDKLYRMFHPKGSGYMHFADKWMETIKANRDDPIPQSLPPPPPAQTPTKALSIVLEQDIWPSEGDTEQRWMFFETKYQEAVRCRDEKNPSMKHQTPDNHDLGLIDNLGSVYPPSDQVIKGLWGEDCTYKTTGSNAGRLFCLSNGGGYECKEEPNRGKEGLIQCDEIVARHPAVYCEW